MKKIFAFLFTAFFVLTVQAQSVHLKFMGIPLDGKISAFNRKLQKNIQ